MHRSIDRSIRLLLLTTKDGSRHRQHSHSCTLTHTFLYREWMSECIVMSCGRIILLLSADSSPCVPRKGGLYYGIQKCPTLHCTTLHGTVYNASTYIQQISPHTYIYEMICLVRSPSFILVAASSESVNRRPCIHSFNIHTLTLHYTTLHHYSTHTQSHSYHIYAHSFHAAMWQQIQSVSHSLTHSADIQSVSRSAGTHYAHW